MRSLLKSSDPYKIKKRIDDRKFVIFQKWIEKSSTWINQKILRMYKIKKTVMFQVNLKKKKELVFFFEKKKE